MNQLLRIEGCSDYQEYESGMPDKETIEQIRDAAISVLANEIPGFQVGPNIGRSTLGVLATLDVIQETITDHMGSDGMPDTPFRYSRQTPRPLHNELARTGPAVAPEFMEMYQLPPHVDRGERGLAVHLQGDIITREVQLAHLRDEARPLVVSKTIGGFLAPEAVQYSGSGIGDEHFTDYVGGQICSGETSQGVMTIFSEGNMDFPSLSGRLRTSIHFFKNPPRNTTSSWTRFTGRENDSSLTPEAIEQKNATFIHTFMHMQATQMYINLKEEHGLHSADIGRAARASSADGLADVLHQLQKEGILNSDGALALQRYVLHPGHANHIAYAEDCGPFLLYEGDLS
ncbi:MAG TPA: hypothetical protein VJ843_02090 [Candidatus Saccharimonadales bacterium]|nr:hypothetical protein [Candidatus Saccharimonadales bacterium]